MAEDKSLVVFKHGDIEVTQEQKTTFIGFISQQSPTEPELMLHFDFCARRGVHPLDRLIYFTKRQGKYTPVTSIDYMRIRAESSGVYAGSDDAVFKGVHKEINKEFPGQATITVYKMVEGQRCPFTATARFDEYAPDLMQSAAFMWKTKPHVMLAKCAEGLALRKAFPGQLSGLYTTEEYDQSSPHELVSHAANQSHSDVVEGEVTFIPETGEIVEPKQKAAAAAAGKLPASSATLSGTKDAPTPARAQSPEEPQKPSMATVKESNLDVWNKKIASRDPKDTISQVAADWIQKTFAEHKTIKVKQHLTAHLKLHFECAKVADLSYEKATAFVSHLDDRGDDPRWYKPEEKTATPETTSDVTDTSGVDLDKLAQAWKQVDHSALSPEDAERIKNMTALVKAGALEKDDYAGMVDVLRT